MKVQSQTKGAWCALDDESSGEGLAVFVGQSPTDSQRWRLDVYAHLDTGADMLVGTIFVSPPSATVPVGQPTRQVLAAVCPGAKTWSVYASPVIPLGEPGFDESINIELISSKCCTAPVGATRVNERYGYIAGDASPAGILIEAGMTVTQIRAHGVGAGTIEIAMGGAAPLVRVANGADVSLFPKAPLPPGTVITFTFTTWLVEFLESA
jgi:hypothetical protein